MSKHTKGPWFVSDEYSGIVVDSDGIRVAAACTDKPYEQHDATLIAAAPDLLEACQDFVNAVRAGSKQEIMLAIDAADKKARAAIAKAKGEE